MKPHGCAEALRRAQEFLNAGDNAAAIELAKRFMLTRSELNELTEDDPTNQVVFSKLIANVADHPFYATGWSASEAYIRKKFDEVIRPAKAANRPLADDEFTLVDIGFNDQGHKILAEVYGLAESRVLVRVDKVDFTTDRLFLYLQALYGLDHLINFAKDSDKAVLEDIRTLLTNNCNGHEPVVAWFDVFLPAWIRLTWRLGLCTCRKIGGTLVRSNEIDIDLPDYHVPWYLESIERPDLQSAAWILARMWATNILHKYDATKYPGALIWSDQLVVPFPEWNSGRPIDLLGLQPLAMEIKADSAFVTKMRVIRVNWDNPGEPILGPPSRACKEIADQLSLVRLVTPDGVTDANWEDI